LGENEPVRRFEFDLFRDELNRWRDGIEIRVDDLEDEHDADVKAIAAQRTTDLQAAQEHREHRREWTWGQIAAVAAAGIAALGLCLQAAGR
jgi:hypothetical protein